jgi:hypothetical protein
VPDVLELRVPQLRKQTIPELAEKPHFKTKCGGSR